MEAKTLSIVVERHTAHHTEEKKRETEPKSRQIQKVQDATKWILHGRENSWKNLLFQFTCSVFLSNAEQRVMLYIQTYMYTTNVLLFLIDRHWSKNKLIPYFFLIFSVYRLPYSFCDYFCCWFGFSPSVTPHDNG